MSRNPLSAARAAATAVRVAWYVQRHPGAYSCCIREAIPAANLDAVLFVMERSGFLRTKRRRGSAQRAYDYCRAKDRA